MAILESDKVDFKEDFQEQRGILHNDERVSPPIIAIFNVYSPNKGASKYMKQNW